MSLDKISAQISSFSTEKGQKIPPVELWDPPYCGEMDLVIKADGSWFYNGTIFKRLALVKLLASVLKKEGGEYFLVTPVEKVKITVEDAPLLLNQWRWQDDDEKFMVVSTSLADEFILDAQHPITLADDGSLYVVVRRNLLAKVHRNVYYQWVDLAQATKTERGTELVFNSGDQVFSLGVID